MKTSAHDLAVTQVRFGGHGLCGHRASTPQPVPRAIASSASPRVIGPQNIGFDQVMPAIALLFSCVAVTSIADGISAVLLRCAPIDVVRPVIRRDVVLVQRPMAFRTRTVEVFRNQDVDSTRAADTVITEDDGEVTAGSIALRSKDSTLPPLNQGVPPSILGSSDVPTQRPDLASVTDLVHSLEPQDRDPLHFGGTLGHVRSPSRIGPGPRRLHPRGDQLREPTSSLKGAGQFAP